jgi:pSer/pThr/pTyr-binding forkhead associated (FHA) protein
MDAGLVCDHCDALNGLDARTCASCGRPLVSSKPATKVKAIGQPAPARAAMKNCPQCNMEVPDGFRFCGNCGARFDAAPAPEAGGARTLFFGAMQAPNRAKLILIKGEGMDGISYHLNATEHVAGREEGAILFPEDPLLSPRHATFFYEGSRLLVRDEGSANGVFVRMTKPVPLAAGSRFLVGEQLLQFEPCNDEDVTPQADEDGTYFYSSPRRPSRFKLIQILRGGDIGMIYRAPTDEVTLGRDGNDINFPDDPYISGQHSMVSATPQGYFLTDLGSKNGTFVVLNGPSELLHGDYVFLGQQLLRVEIT